MEFENNILHLGSFFAVTMGIVVLFIGRRLNQVIGFLKEFSIPEPVSGGILASLLFAALYATTSIEVQFDLFARDVLLVYFFTTIGINSSLKDLFKGGKPLVILLAITIFFMIMQNIVGISVASMFGLEPVFGLLSGSISLIGGHGTAIAWAPKVAEEFGLESAMEIGIASATFGLILASLMGGPIAKFLIKRHNLKPTDEQSGSIDSNAKKQQQALTSFQFLDAVLAIHICVIVGALLNELISQTGLQLPLFVSCLFAGIVITNVMPDSYPRISGAKWPTRSPAIDLIAEISLGTFLAMSLMSMQLWTLIDLAGPIFAILAMQLLLAVIINIFIVFPSMGKTYDAAVVCAGFGGISLGSTPTAMANMSAVSQKYGHSAQAFIIVPLVCAFFIDLANALIIPYFMRMM
ncbi:sodium/glutamate symporter [Vibrio sp. 10N.222.51.C8]|jgi:ESS family glutamate:Na+ symporter|uniref:Sodium/glutamate symporter n=5 Tax=Vibrio TaxID=662 RepID=A0A1B9QC01_VIBSP|nr:MULTISPECIES: sodium/glutamate symporter [Vibrio]MBO7910608.1 sodium/glutamate symporter [Vibrio sp. G41H]MCC4787628.1 sodium/glutamate symporter [Vibrio splendidus]MCC5518920.1 sodium/glutamate symporter [Vibrio splendidus]MCF7489440.1 sodium/glutamate symporter [Vibrio sp. G-C-1]MCQ8868454.1 sodium/glutamate symporter [Vibrio splendidus]